jgi:hypothetical protein
MTLKIIISLGTIFMGISEGITQESIQGKAYPNRINGVYDASVTNQEIDCFLESLKKAVTQDDPAETAKLLSYPCRWNTKKHHKAIKSEKEFIQNYKFIMTGKVKQAILCTCIDDLFVNSQGFMLGNGEVWFDPRIGIISFNS